MTKFRILVAIAILAISCKQSDNEDQSYNTLFFENLKGEVLTVETTPYTVDSTGKIGDIDSCCVVLDEYNKDGYITWSTEKEKDGTVKSQTTFTHYDNGRIKEIVRMANGKLDNKLEIQIDSAGKYVSAARYDSSGNPMAFYTDLSQDKYGHLLTGTQLNADSSVKRSWKNMFDQQNYVGGETKDSTGKVIYKAEATVNDKGNTATMNSTSIEKDSTIKKNIIYTYNSFDEQGNWTERSEAENGKPVKIVKRTITYATKEK